MEAIEELEFMDNNDATTVTHIAKGKRTKRQRPFSPCAVVAAAVAAGITTSSSSSTTVSGDHAAATDYGSISSATTTNYESTEEEEDMANCLILLAQGGDHHTARNNTTAIAIAKQRQSDSDIQSLAQSERGGSRRFAEMAAATTAAARIGFYVYECKTCNRTFPSFQALGGHRASHKKPKLVVVEEKKPPPPPPVSSQIIHNFEIEEAQLKSGAQISLQLGSNNNKAAKIHECSICGSEFTSGQALGGHMRRHRASTSTSSTTTTNSTPPPLNQNGAAVEMKPRNILALDLNLPAPEEDLRDSKFQFTPKQKALVMSAPSLVGCHY